MAQLVRRIAGGGGGGEEAVAALEGHVASHAGVVLKPGHNEQVRGARHGVALHDVGAHYGPHVLAVVGGVHLQGGG